MSKYKNVNTLVEDYQSYASPDLATNQTNGFRMSYYGLQDLTGKKVFFDINMGQPIINIQLLNDNIFYHWGNNGFKELNSMREEFMVS